MEMTARSSSGANGANVHDFLFELVTERCSTLSSSSQSKLSLYYTVNSWNRYSKISQADGMCLCQLQTLKAACVSQSAAGSPCTLIYWNQDWRRKDDTRVQQNDKTHQPASGELLTWAVYLDLMGTYVISVLFVSQQRNVCSPSGLLSCHLTAHFLKVRITARNLK